VNGVNAFSALTFGTLLSSQESDAHRASDFRLKLRGNSPNFTVSSGAGQIGLFRPSLPARPSDRNPPRRVSATKTFREFVGATGRFRVPRLAPTRRTLLTFAVQMQIGVPDLVRTLAKRLHAGLPALPRSSGRPSGHITHLRLRERHPPMMPHRTSAPHESFRRGIRRGSHRTTSYMTWCGGCVMRDVPPQRRTTSVKSRRRTVRRVRVARRQHAQVHRASAVLGDGRGGSRPAPTCHVPHRPADASRRVAARSG
jgi:hypothetical protein